MKLNAAMMIAIFFIFLKFSIRIYKNPAILSDYVHHPGDVHDPVVVEAFAFELAQAAPI